ncbi:hypothetical protein ACFV4G_40070 [Kitasatospora sp. NPDC059747]|uniref:hypothetical protein n=1 Tax=Kitasatospora sp. NPDC059747 TaxID=3346930 RepID=UPI0036512458
MHVARTVEALRPCLLVVENVRGLLTSPAGSPGDVEPCPWCLGDDPTRNPTSSLNPGGLRRRTRWPGRQQLPVTSGFAQYSRIWRMQKTSVGAMGAELSRLE